MTEKEWPSLERVKELEHVIRPTPTVGPNGTVTVNRDTATDIADTLDKVRDQIESEIDRDPKPSRTVEAMVGLGLDMMIFKEGELLDVRIGDTKARVRVVDVGPGSFTYEVIDDSEGALASGGVLRTVDPSLPLATSLEEAKQISDRILARRYRARSDLDEEAGR